jgi:hypothetical protein
MAAAPLQTPLSRADQAAACDIAATCRPPDQHGRRPLLHQLEPCLSPVDGVPDAVDSCGCLLLGDCFRLPLIERRCKRRDGPDVLL